MDNFELPPMKFHNFVRMFILPVDFVITLYFSYQYFIKEDLLISAAFRNAIYAYFAVKLVQTIVNVITQVGFITYSGYAFYGILVYFGLRIVLWSLTYFGHIEPVFNRALPEIVKVDLVTDIFGLSVFLISIVTMGIVVLYYLLRKDAFYFRDPRTKRAKPIKDRNYPWHYNEKYKPGRKLRISRRKMNGLKDRRLDIVAGKETIQKESSEADVNDSL